MKEVIIMSLFFFSFSIMANEENRKIKVNLETNTNALPARYLLPQKRDRSSFQGIPSGLTEKNSIIKCCPLGVDSVFILLGDLDSAKRICIIDANQNRDFSDDYVYAFNQNEITEKTNFPPQLIPYHVKNEAGMHFRIKYFRPVLFDCKSISVANDTLFHKYYITLSPSEYYEGYFNLNDKAYKIIVCREMHRNEEWFKYVFTDSSATPDLKDIEFNTLSDNTLLDSYKVNHVELQDDNSSLLLDVSPISVLNKSELAGFNPGFYAIPFN